MGTFQESFCSLHGILQDNWPLQSKNLTRSTWPSWAASMRGVEHPSSMSAPTSIRNLATSRKPPQQANVRAVSWVSSVWALMFAPVQSAGQTYTAQLLTVNTATDKHTHFYATYFLQHPTNTFDLEHTSLTFKLCIKMWKVIASNRTLHISL